MSIYEAAPNKLSMVSFRLSIKEITEKDIL